MIYVGYQGIGKSTISKIYSKCIDLESGNTFVNGKRPENWEALYVNFALSLNNQGYDIFISSHKVVREELNKRNIEFIAIVPDLSLKEDWIHKLHSRYLESNAEKDYKAYMNAKECYEENIKDILKDSKKSIVIRTMAYILADLIYGQSPILQYMEVNRTK